MHCYHVHYVLFKCELRMGQGSGFLLKDDKSYVVNIGFF